jgi:hypothetical protein
MVAALIIVAMLLVLALACVTTNTILRIVGCGTGLLLGLREFVMLANSDAGFLEVVREPNGWIGPALFVLFVVSACVAIAGGRR